MELDPYDWVIVHKEGRRHSNADAMSRIPVVSSMTPKPFTQTVSVQTDDSSVIFRTSGYADTKHESYAVAINVPRNQCEWNFDPSNFLTQDKDVKNGIYNTENKFYNGTDLMAEGHWPCNCKVIENCISKSVSVLLQNDSLQTFKNFAQRRNDGCIVIYTVYSPCLNLSGYDIIPSLDILKNHTGIKAFVFKKVYNVNENDHRCSDIARNFTEIKSVVFLNGLLLLFLLHHWTESVEGQEMNLMTLARIIDFIEKNYADTKHESYAVAINVPRNQCEWNFDPSNFLTQDKDVKNGIYNTENKFYNGYSKPCIIDLINIL
ncbi:paired box Pax-3 [Labeo rohita]|uniref:Paired box Pax-3 n=1 Tax=Labeo rohita TaxID=84645 RepID=A0A498NH10_LABRO|nr:paired box Pax-3 [Labeo rohita]